MAINPKKPFERILRELSAMDAYPAFAPVELFATPFADDVTVLIRYEQSQVGARALMTIDYVCEDGRGYDVVTVDPAITVLAGVGFQNDADTTVIRFPARSGDWAYSFRTPTAKTVKLSFAETTAGAAGLLQVAVICRLT